MTLKLVWRVIERRMERERTWCLLTTSLGTSTCNSSSWNNLGRESFLLHGLRIKMKS